MNVARKFCSVRDITTYIKMILNMRKCYGSSKEGDAFSLRLTENEVDSEEMFMYGRVS